MFLVHVGVDPSSLFCLLRCWEGMDNVLRQLENLSRDELVWLNLTGRLRALPPTGSQPPEPRAHSSMPTIAGANARAFAL